ncbi:MAG: hypothetical protein KZQ72_08155, partial [Candidatus Thiodiazotropha sp. (ex Cardiolucina cf. quadrata)]|nr:hypothetical protein [Candidatus Thiodiazotropha sp. (ex Cardiolucina cf. quadrata)]
IFCSCLSTLWQKSLKLSFSLSYCWGPPLEEILINTTEWYAPGVGLVKLLREEPLDNDVFAGGHVLLELKDLMY